LSKYGAHDGNLNDDLRTLDIEFTPAMKVVAKLSLLKEKIEHNQKAGIEVNVDWNTYEIDRVKFFKKQSAGYNALNLLKL